MNVSADSLFLLARAAGCPTGHRAEGVVIWATEQLKRKGPENVAVTELRDAAAEALKYLRDPAFNPRHDEVVERLRRAIERSGP